MLSYQHIYHPPPPPGHWADVHKHKLLAWMFAGI